MDSSYQSREYSIVRYDSSWPLSFNELRAKVSGIFKKDALDIEHIGSTAVPGMSGKPVIDVLVIVDKMSVVEAYTPHMDTAGFSYHGSVVSPDSCLFREMSHNTLLANIHVFPIGHPHIQEMLAIRDYLRTHPDEAVEYSRLKNDLYTKYKNDYAKYRQEKDEYMASLTKRAAQFQI